MSHSTGVYAAMLFSLILLAGCMEEKSPSQIKEKTLKGVTFTPLSFQSSDFMEFLGNAEKMDVISWAGDWNELSGNGGPIVLTELAGNYDYMPLIELQFFDQSSGKLLRPLNEKTRKDYKEYIVAYVRIYKPGYIALGIEVNILYEKSPTDFDAFVPFYNEVYEAAKTVSPDTKVFTIFQLEKMKGLGGLFGGTNTAPQWHLLNKFNSDILAFTTYPCLIYKNPSDIPQDYYAEIKSHTTKPIAFTEIGWFSAGPKGWESSEEEQVEFIGRFFQLAQGLDLEIAIWSFMYDQDTVEPFGSMGLFRKDGSAKSAWEEWLGVRKEENKKEAAKSILYFPIK